MNNFKPITQYFDELIKNSSLKAWLGALIPPALIVAILWFQKKGTLQWLDKNVSPVLMLLALIALFVGIPALFKNLKQSLIEHPISKFQWGAFFLILISSSYLALNHIDAQHRVQSDESIFLATAQNIYHQQTAATCDEGYFDTNQDLNCVKNATSFKTKILSLIYAVGMPIFGKSLYWIFNLQFFFFIGSLFFLFFGIHLWLKNPFLTLTTAALFAFTPTILFQFRSASVEPLYVLLAFIALLQTYFIHHKKTSNYPDQKTFNKVLLIEWTALIGTMAMLAQTRQESLFCLGAFIVLVLPQALKSKWHLTYIANLFTLLILPAAFLILSYRGYGFQGGEFEAHGFQNFVAHIKINFVEMTKPLRSNGLLENPFLGWFTYLSLFGFILIILQSFFKRSALILTILLGLYHIQSYVIFENISGDFTIHINQRYALVILPSMAFLGAYFLDQVLKFVTKFYEVKSPLIKEIIPSLLAIIIIGSLTFKHTESFEKNILFNRNHLTTEEQTIHKWMDKKPGRKLFLYDRPWHFIGYGQSAASYHEWRRFSPAQKLDLAKDYDNEVYYVRGLRCYDKKSYHKKAVETRAPQWCDQFEANNSLERVLDTNVTNSYPLQISKIRVGRNPNLDKPLIDYKTKIKGDSVQFTFKWNKDWQGQAHLRKSNQKQAELISKNDSLIVRSLNLGSNEFTLYFSNQDQSAPEKPVSFHIFQNSETSQKLNSLKPQIHKQSWGKLRNNRSVNGNPLKVKDQIFKNGLGTHSNSYAKYQLPVGFSTFEFGIGLDDEDTGGDGVIFKVLGNGKEIFNSGQLLPRQIRWNKINIEGLSSIELVVDSLKNKDFDHADWIEPTLWK